VYARVTTFQFYPDKLEQAHQMAESIAPAIRQQHGLKSYLELLDRTTGKALLISVFETEADAKAGVSSGFVQQQVDKVASLLVGAPTVEFFEVDAHE
jgi:quinol monooxygenase YgiN